MTFGFVAATDIAANAGKQLAATNIKVAAAG
jgi:hypothetical protein